MVSDNCFYCNDGSSYRKTKGQQYTIPKWHSESTADGSAGDQADDLFHDRSQSSFFHATISPDWASPLKLPLVNILGFPVCTEQAGCYVDTFSHGKVIAGGVCAAAKGGEER